MKKKLIALNLILILQFFSFNLHAIEPFKCMSHYKTVIEKDHDSTLFDGRLTLFLKNDSEGFFEFIGKIKTNEKNYLLSRTVFFSMASHEINESKQVTIGKVVKHLSDTTPDDIWQADILPQLPGIDFQIEIRRLKNNLILVKSLNTAYLICAAE
ncbi:hypothetical protein V1603_07790 [Enterobacter sp. ECC-219]|uniref:hypothetical protein n=1 Tax=Enterobacter sp. ECC-219 TaxID=3116480 RepID=UPI0037544041